MQKKVLIAVDGSNHARNAMLYAAGFFTPGIDLKLSLIHVQPIISQYFVDEARSNPKIEAALQRVVEENTANSMELLKKSKALLMREGIAETAIETISRTRMLGMTKDIIEYAHENQFDAIIAGRRGLSRIQKVFMGSTSTKLIEHSGNIPVCIVDGEARPRRVLVAVDIQEFPNAIVNLVGRLFSGLPEVRLTFYHVLQNLRLSEVAPFTPGVEEIEEEVELHEKQLIETFWEEATRHLTAAGLKEEQLNMKAPRRITKTAKMIIDEAEKNDFDTVIIGRTGSDKAFYFGNVARYVSERIAERAVWLAG
jgi:nucleotide-binding universal stress UspA family protein